MSSSVGAGAAAGVGLEGAAPGPTGAALDLHEESSHPEGSEPARGAASGGCVRWPERFRLLSSHGELVRGRCHATNLCEYCARLGAIENAELLALDALAGSAPAVWAVLTTSEATRDTRRFYRSREAVLRALRRRWPSCEYAALVEFTTGYGTNSGGRRRPHWNLLLKGIEAAELDAAAAVIRRVWCDREQARPEAQHVGLVGEFGGLMRYVALHFQKSSQAPPPGWRGHRFLKSRGYLATSTPAARAAARESLAFKRELWRAIRRGLTGTDAEAAAVAARELAAATSWQLVRTPGLGLESPGSVGRPSERGAACGAVPGESHGRASGPDIRETRSPPARRLPSDELQGTGRGAGRQAVPPADLSSRRPTAAGADARGRSPVSVAGTWPFDHDQVADVANHWRPLRR